MTVHEFQKFLDFLLAHAIITSQEYNDLHLQALPFLKLQKIKDLK